MTGPILRVPSQVYRAVQRHLLPRKTRTEAVAFLFVTRIEADTFKYIEWYQVPASGFVSRSSYHLELTDETRGGVIKRAHDLGASLVELHSHLGPLPAEFSESDLAGFRDFVPHVLWRLKNKPYFAIVMTRASFDGFAWLTSPTTPQRLAAIEIGDAVLTPTGLSSLSGRDYDKRAF